MRKQAAGVAGVEAGPVTRRGFLKKAGVGGLTALAMGAVGDVLASPLASASGIHPSKVAGRRTVVIDNPNDPSVTCDGVATCSPCNGCCPGGPCPLATTASTERRHPAKPPGFPATSTHPRSSPSAAFPGSRLEVLGFIRKAAAHVTVAALILRYVLAVVFLRSAGCRKMALQGPIWPRKPWWRCARDAFCDSLSGSLKALDISDFRVAVGNYRLLPEPLVGVASWALPTLELVCGVLLVVGVANGPVATVLVGLLAVFSVAVAVNLLRGRAISCGCSGRGASEITWRHVATNVGLAGVAAVVSVWAVQPLTVAAVRGVQPQPLLGDGGALGVLVAVGAAASGGLLVAEALRVRGLWGRIEMGRRHHL